MTGACSFAFRDNDDGDGGKRMGTMWKSIQITALRIVVLLACKKYVALHISFHMFKEIMHKQALNKVNLSQKYKSEFQSLTIY